MISSNRKQHYNNLTSKIHSIGVRVVVLGTCTREVLEYTFKVLLLVLGSNVLVLVLLLDSSVLVLVLVLGP